jgi:protein-tyrosine phosphatase
MTKIFERLYLGDARDAEHLAVSNPQGITTVISVVGGRNRGKADGIEYVHLSFDDAETVPPAKFEKALTAIREHIRKGKVLVHCEIGSSRSPVLVALYMHVVGYKDFHQALAELHELRPVVAPSDWMLQCAQTYLEAM